MSINWESLGIKMYRSREHHANKTATKVTVMAFPDDKDWMVMRLFETWVKINAAKFHKLYETTHVPSIKN